MNRTISWFNRSMMALGVLAGANTACSVPDSKPGSPASATVGNPGTSADGCALATAKALTRPDLIYGAPVLVGKIIICTSPAASAMIAELAPL